MKRILRRALSLLPPFLLLGALVQALLAAVDAWSYLPAGYPVAFFHFVRRAVWLGLGLGALFVPLYLLFDFVLRRLVLPRLGRPSDPLLTFLAAGLAWSPIFAVIGYRMNRLWGLRPSELLTSYGATTNLTMLAVMVVVWVLTALYLLRRSGDRRESGGAPAFPWKMLAAVVVLVAALSAGVYLASRQPREGEPETPVIVLLVDALRADHLSAYGYGIETSPAIDALAADGVLFEDTVSPSTFTKTSIASLFTGRDPFQHGVYWGNIREKVDSFHSDILSQDETTLAELLRSRDYLTVGWVQNSHIQDFMGYGQGFVDYNDQMGSIKRINGIALPWFAEPGRRYGFFAYLHYIDLHDPYEPPPPYDTMYRTSDLDPYEDVNLSEWGAFLASVNRGDIVLTPEQVTAMRELYDELIRYIDDEIGKLLEVLKENDLYDRSLIILTADHGDAFGEHGNISHANLPYEEVMRVPLIVKLPHGEHAGLRVKSQARLVDVLPTIAELVGKELSPRRPLAGCSLMPLIEEGEDAPRKPQCLRAVTEIAEMGSYPHLVLREGGWKYIHQQKEPEELYYLPDDPGETRNLAESEPERLAAFREQADAIIEARKSLKTEQLELGERAIRELKALGYVE